MADFNMPSITDLSQLQFLPNGTNLAAGQGINNALAAQQTGLKIQDQDLQSKLLQNLFDASNNPTKLQQGQANLDGTLAESIVKRIDAKQRQDLAPEELAAKRQKMVTGMADDQLKEFNAHVEQQMQSDDPAIREKAVDAFNRSAKEMSRRATAADTQANTRIIMGSREKVAAGHDEAGTERAKILADAKVQAKAASAPDFETMMYKYAHNPAAAAELRIVRGQTLLAQGKHKEAAEQFNLAQQARERAAEGDSNRGLAQPGVDAAAVADLPAKARPSATAPVRPVGPPPLVNTPTVNGNPAPMSGIPGPDEAISKVMPITEAEQEYMRTKDPKAKAIIAEQIKKERAEAAKPAAGGLPQFSGPSDPGFAKLPSGAKFIGPNGKEYTKH